MKRRNFIKSAVCSVLAPTAMVSQTGAAALSPFFIGVDLGSGPSQTGIVMHTMVLSSNGPRDRLDPQRIMDAFIRPLEAKARARL